jgi:hypothetical protein
LKSSLETAEVRMGETADDRLVVNVRSDSVGGDVSRGKLEPFDQSAVDVQTCKMAKAFDTCCCQVLEFVDGVARDRGAIREETIDHPGMGVAGSTDPSEAIAREVSRRVLGEPIKVLSERDLTNYHLLMSRKRTEELRKGRWDNWRKRSERESIPG